MQERTPQKRIAEDAQHTLLLQTNKFATHSAGDQMYAGLSFGAFGLPRNISVTVAGCLDCGAYTSKQLQRQKACMRTLPWNHRCYESSMAREGSVALP